VLRRPVQPVWSRPARSIAPAGPTGSRLKFQGTQVLSQILGREGVEFDARKYEWLGARLIGELFKMSPAVLAKLKELLR
jgi:hypothetical protein